MQPFARPLHSRSTLTLTRQDRRIIAAFGKHPAPSLKERLRELRASLRDPNLTRRQQKLLQRMAVILDEDLAPYQGRPLEDLDEKEREYLQAALAHYTRTIIQAVRADLSKHPWVERWLETRRALGERGVLRRAKVGLERGVRKPVRLIKNTRTESIDRETARLRRRGLSLRSIYRVLANKGLLTPPGRPRPVTWQAFHKWVRRRGF